LVNGVVCKDPKDVKAEDFLFRGLQRMGNTSNAVGSNVTAVTVNQLAGLNTFGISMARIDFAPWGLNAPHTHPFVFPQVLKRQEKIVREVPVLSPEEPPPMI
nr:putative germin-like protein 2-1 [Tanacetum cinerariifolium]